LNQGRLFHKGDDERIFTDGDLIASANFWHFKLNGPDNKRFNTESVDWLNHIIEIKQILDSRNYILKLSTPFMEFKQLEDDIEF
jgi:hypothetical protein